MKPEPLVYWSYENDGSRNLWKRWWINDDITVYEGKGKFSASAYQTGLPGLFDTYEEALAFAISNLDN